MPIRKRMSRGRPRFIRRGRGRRVSFRRRTFRRSIRRVGRSRGSRFKSRRRFSSRTNLKAGNYAARRIQTIYESPFPPNDDVAAALGVGLALADALRTANNRSFITCYTPNTSASTAERATVAATPASNTTYGRFYRYPWLRSELTGNQFIQNGVSPSPVTGSSLPMVTGGFNDGQNGVATPVALYSGFTCNMVYCLAQVPFERLTNLWGAYKQVRIKRIRTVIYMPDGANFKGTNSGQVYTTGAQVITGNVYNNSFTADAYAMTGFTRGIKSGTVLAMCTRSTGPIIDDSFLNPDVGGGIDPAFQADYQSQMYRYHSTNRLIHDPKFRRRLARRFNVCRRMRPIRFSFRPTVIAPRFGISGAMGTVVRNQIDGSTIRSKLVPSPWLPTQIPSDTLGASYTARTIFPTNDSRADSDSRVANSVWYLPHFGLYVGMQPLSSHFWPFMRYHTSFDLEFKDPIMTYTDQDVNGSTIIPNAYADYPSNVPLGLQFQS